MKKVLAIAVTLATLLTTSCSALLARPEDGKTKLEYQARRSPPTYTESFMFEECAFSSTGRNPFFILEPGYQLILEGKEKKKNVHLAITVLNETKQIDGIETRVVEERQETREGQLEEIAKNYFAICNRTNSVFYFGEDVDIYENGTVVSHQGAWHAGSNGAKAGLMMPGIILLGARYVQEIAPGIALDRAEIVSMNETIQTPAGEFQNALQMLETTPLEPRAKDFKFYAAGVGLIQSNDLKLVKFGRLPP